MENALVKVTKAIKRLPGQAQGNPLIAAVSGFTPENVSDLDAEIEATEDYLLGLKAMRMVATATAVPSRPVDVPEPAVNGKRTYAKRATPEVVVEVVTPAPAEPQSAAPAPAPAPADDVADEDTVIAEMPQVGVEVDPDDDDDDAIETTVESTAAARRVTALRPMRMKIAEFIFKKGLATTGDILRGVKCSPRIVSELMEHPWFEYTGSQYRLSPAGRKEGLKDYL